MPGSIGNPLIYRQQYFWFICKNNQTFEVPDLLITDRGPRLVAKKVKIYLGTKSNNYQVTKPYHPHINRRIRCLIGSLVEIISKLSAEKPTDWVKILSLELSMFRAKNN